MHFFGFVVEVEALELGNLVFTGVEQDHQLVVHLGEVVEEGGDEESIEVLFGGVVEEEGLDGTLESIVTAHPSNDSAVVLQYIQLTGQSIP